MSSGKKRSTSVALLLAAAALRGAAAQGAVGLTYSSYTGGTCPQLSTCVTSGFTYIYDLTGNVVFVPKSTDSSCDAFVGFANAGNTTVSGSLQLTNDGSTYVTATYTATQMMVPATAACVVTFARGAVGSNNDETAELNYASYSGGASCAPDGCTTAGYNFIVHASTATVAFLSRSGNESTACNGYVGTATPSGNGGSIAVDYELTGNSVQQPFTTLTATYSETGLTSTGGGCTYNFVVAQSSAAAGSAGKLAAVAATVFAAAAVAAFF
jgi:hypothetical protein